MERRLSLLAVVTLALGLLVALVLALPAGQARAGLTQAPAAARPDTAPRAGQIVVSPTAVDAVAVEPAVVTRVLTITNAGTGTLQFQVVESAVALAPPPAAGRTAAREAADRGWLAGEVQVDAGLLAAMRTAGTADVIVQMRRQADLSASYGIQDWKARGRYVYDALVAASRAQTPVLRYARTRGLETRSFLINNAVLIRAAGPADVESLAARADVRQLRGTRAYPLEPAERAPAAPDTAGWNLGALNPNGGLWGMAATQVWQEFGLRGACPGCAPDGGDTIVIGLVDTGAYYLHNALVRQYRGNLGGGTFDHNYNWYQPVGGACGDTTVPCDWSGHGSGSTGLAVGETENLVEQIGVAPAARWIACMGCDKRPNSCTDEALMACGDWMLAPTRLDGSAPDPDLRPHIANNSWGGDPCDPWYQGKVEVWHAAGILPAFSAGNAATCSNLSSPGDYVAALATAAHGTTGRNLYAGGPSCYANPPSCDPFAHEIKPNLNAPTFGRTAGNAQDAYYNMSGTSGASPHTAGCAALVWSGQPALIGDVDATYALLEQTADRSLLATWNGGKCGKPACAGTDTYPNYEFGWGYLDCHAAISALHVPWLSAGVVSGTVPPGEQQTVALSMTCTLTDALKMQPLTAWLHIRADDPAQPALDVPISFLCLAHDPVPHWAKELSINGQAVTSLAGPHAVRPGDLLTIVDRAGAFFSETITATLAETWSPVLALVSHEAGAGSVSAGETGLTWSLAGVAPNTLYVLTRTWQVQSGSWITGQVSETLAVEGAVAQPAGITITVRHTYPALSLAKTGPSRAVDGEVVGLALTITGDGTLRDTAVVSDVLPAGMTYAGSLTSTYGTAWQQANAIYWSNALTAPALLPPLPAQVTVTFDVQVQGSLGQVLHNVAELAWGGGLLAAGHDVRISGTHALYLPVVYKGP